MRWPFTAVAHMHERHVMHRDLKPANIFLTLNGTVKVGDLGLGRYLSEHTLEAFSKVGTPLYMSPEVLQGKGYDYKSDVWSLGCVLYELAMLISPFKEEGLNLYGLFQKISKGTYPGISTLYSTELQDLVARMLSSDPAARPDMGEVTRISCALLERFEQQRQADRAAAPPASTPAGGTAAAETVAQQQAPDPEQAAAAEVAAAAAADAAGPGEGKTGDGSTPTQPTAGASRGQAGRSERQGGAGSGVAVHAPEAALGSDPATTPVARGGAASVPPTSPPRGFVGELLAQRDALALSARAVSRLQCLGYEVGWAAALDTPPLPPYYFAVPDAVGAAGSTVAQFHTFASLVSWCLSILRDPPRSRGATSVLGRATTDCIAWGPEGKYGPPNVVGDAVCRSLQEAAGAPAALVDACLPRDVAAGHGLAVARLLDFAAHSALTHIGWRWEAPAFPPSGDGVEEDEGAGQEVDGADGGVAEAVVGGDDAVDSDEDVLFSEERKTDHDAGVGDTARKDFVRSNVSPQAWSKEVERVKRSIAARLRSMGLVDVTAAAQAGGGGWRAHFAATQANHERLQRSQPKDGLATGAALAALERSGAGAGDAAERIRSAETRINAEHSGDGGVIGQYRTLHEQAVTLRETVQALSAQVEEGATHLAELGEEVEALEEAVAARGDSVSDASPLQRIRTALAALRKEKQSLGVRLGIALQRWEAACARAAEEKRQAARRGAHDSDLEFEDEEAP